MGTKILHQLSTADRREMACLYDSVTGWAFGPVFEASDECELDAYEMADAFTDFVQQKCGCDPKNLRGDKLAANYKNFLSAIKSPGSDSKPCGNRGDVYFEDLSKTEKEDDPHADPCPKCGIFRSQPDNLHPNYLGWQKSEE